MSENESPLEELFEGDEESPENEELEQTEESTEEEVDDTVRKSDLEALNKTLNELRAEVGRLQAIEARVKRVEDPSDRAELEARLRQEIGRVNEVTASLVSGLDETAFVDPEVRSRVKNFLDEARTKAEREKLLNEIKAELQPQQRQQSTDDGRPEWYTPAVQAFEEEWADRIEDEGFDSSGEGDFKEAWMRAGAALRAGAPLATARQIMREQLKVLKAERSTARQRTQAKKNAGAGTPKAAGGSGGELDPSRSLEDRVEALRKMGIQVG